MIEALRNTFIEWNQQTTERQKLQHTYIVLLGVVIFLAGLISLFNPDRSRQMILVALALITTFVVNYVVWALLKSTVLDKLPRQARRTTAKPTARRR